MRRVATQVRARIVLGIVAGLVLGGVGSAAAEAKRVGVPKFDGPQEAVVRKAVMQVLKRDGYEVVGSREIDAAARSAGGLDSNEGFKAVAKDLSISSFVTGEVAKKKAKLTVRNGGDGTVSGEGSFAGANPAKIAAEVRDGFARRLGSAVARGRAPSGAKKPVAAPQPPPEDEAEEEAPPVAAKPVPRAPTEESSARETSSESASGESGGSAPDVIEKKAEPAPEAPTDGYAPRALDLFVGFRGFHRSLTFNENVYPADLSDFTLTLGPALAFDGAIFPAGFGTAGVLSYFGAAANIEQAFGVGATKGGSTYPTIVHDYAGAFVFRLPFQAGHEVMASFGGGEHAFSIRSGDMSRATLTELPDTIYRYLRVGAGGRFMMSGGFSLTANAGLRIILNKGGTARHQIAHGGTPEDPNGYFPFLENRLKAFDVNLGLNYLITPFLEFRAAFNLRRYAFAMNSSPGIYPDGDIAPDGISRVNKVAGGAVDQYTSFTVGIAYVFGGVSPGAQPAVEEEAEAPPPPKKVKKKKAKKADDEDEDGGDEDSED